MVTRSSINDVAFIHLFIHIRLIEKLSERNLTSEIQHKTSMIKWKSLPMRRYS